MDTYDDATYLRALAAAKADGNDAAVADIRNQWVKATQARDTAKYNPTLGMSTPQKIAANLGAGMTNIYEGAKQLIGQSSPADMREKAAIDELLARNSTLGGLTQGIGEAAALAPLALIPGANTVAGAAALGGAAGALTPTTNENVLAGKALNAGIGAITGGAVQGGMNYAARKLPGMAQSASEWLASRGLPGGSEAARQRIADKAFSTVLGDPQAARMALMGYQEAIPGVTTTTGAALNNPALLNIERQVRDIGGIPGQSLRTQEALNNAARWRFAQSLGGDSQAIKDQASQNFVNRLASLKPTGTIDPKGQIVSNIDDLIDGQVSKPVKSALEDIRQGLSDALLANNGKGDIGMLHKVRMQLIDDRLSSLQGTDKKAGTALARILAGPNGIKEQIDNAINARTGGRWSKLLQGYAQDITPAAQAEFGNELKQGMSTKATSVLGDPLLTSSASTLRNVAQNPVNRFGTPQLAPQDLNTVQTLLADVERQLSPDKVGVAGRGSPTAANLLDPGVAGIMNYFRPPSYLKTGDTRSAMIGAFGSHMAGIPPVVGAGAGIAANEARKGMNKASEKASADIAMRLMDVLFNQDAAYKALERMSMTPALGPSQSLLMLSRGAPIAGGLLAQGLQ